MKTTTLIPVFGGNRMNAEKPAAFLRGCNFIAVPFAGGLPEVRHFKARTINVNDLNRDAINLAVCIADKCLKDVIANRLTETIFHPDVLAHAQHICAIKRDSEVPCMDWAYSYFICAWMTRSGSVGCNNELKAGMSVRWDAGGGDSNARFRSAISDLDDWHNAMKSCNFTCLDAFEFLGKVRDDPGTGCYCDPPWPSDGEKYKHRFTDARHRKLAETLAEYKQTKVVIRLNDHPLVRELYPESIWTWHRFTSRTQANKAKSEVLIANAGVAADAPG